MCKPKLKKLLSESPNIVASSTVWTMNANAGIEGETRISLNWANIFSVEADPPHRGLVGEAKIFFAWFISEQAASANLLSAATIRNYFTDLRVLLVWMAKNGLFSFADFPESRVVEYLLFRNSTQYGDAPHAKRTLKSKIRLLNSLHCALPTIGVGVIFNVDASLDQRVVTKLANDKRWLPLPDEIAVPLLKDCITWIRGPANEFLSVIDFCQAKKSSSVGLTIDERKKSDFRLIKRNCDYQKMAQLAEFLHLPRDTTWGRILRMGRRETTAACCFVLLFFTGIRVSELLALRRGCIQELPHADGEMFPYLVGLISKNGVRRHQWVAYELIAEVVVILERINAPIYALNGDDRLLAAPPAGSVLMHKGMRFSRKQVRDINDLLKEFASAGRRTVSIASRVHSHQGRETFAQFVGYRDKTGLDALASHYAHAHKRVTDTSYLGNDVDLSVMLAEKDRQDLARSLEDILSTTNIAGGAGGVIGQRFRTVGFRGKEMLQATVDRLIKQGVRLAPCNWGYCLYRAELSACRGDSEGPNEINRSPSVCKSCSNFCVTDKHADWWQIRLERSEKVLEAGSVPTMTRELIGTRIQECNDILGKIRAKKGATKV